MTLVREIRFDGWTLRPASGELRRDGRTVRLQSQPLQVLEALLERPGEMVTREQLISRLWPKGIVDFDTALNSAVRRLRTALGDHADTPRYVETIPKRGYRFIAPLEPTAPEASPPAAATLPLRDPVVPLPIDDPDGAPARATPARRTRSPRWLLAAAAGASTGALGLGAWVWQHSPAQLVAAAPEAIPVDAPDEVLGRIRQARFLLQRRNPGDVARAREHFDAALRLEPRSARAWSGLASCWWIDTMEGRVPRDQGLARTRAAASQALSIEPRLAEAHLRLANVESVLGRADQTDTHVREAMAAEPDDPLVLSFAASRAFDRGALDEAVTLQRRAVAADSLSLVARHNLAATLFVAGRFDEARKELVELLELNPESGDAPELLLAQSLVLTGDPAGALELADRLRDGPGRMQVRALALHALGRDAESDAALAELGRWPLGRRSYLVAEAYAFRGKPDAAFAQLRATVDGDDAPCRDALCWPLDWVASSPLLRPLHADARWATWLAGLRARSSG